MRVAQITDTHISLDVPAREADLEKCISQINELDPLPQLVVHTGDVSHNGLLEEYEVASKHLHALKVPWFVLVGNKDRRKTVLEVFSRRGVPRADFPFVQYAVDEFPIRIVCIDTLCENNNKGDFCQERLKDLEQLLVAAPDRPTALFMHHPTFDVATIPEPFQFVSRQRAEALEQLVGQFGCVNRVFCGHVHRPYEANIGTVPAQVMTAVALDLRKGEQEPMSEDTPLFLLHEL